MKKLMFVCAGLLTVLVSSCGGSKQVVAQQSSAQAAGVYAAAQNHNAIVQSMPCSDAIRNDKEYFGAVGTAYGPERDMNKLLIDAQDNAKDLIINRIGGKIEGMVKTFYESTSTPSGNKREGDKVRYVREVIKRQLNDVDDYCEKHTGMDGMGCIRVYYGISISKKQVSDAFRDAMVEGESGETRKRAEEIADKFQKELDEMNAK